MALINYILHDGSHYELEVEPNTSLMQAAVNNGMDGILAECGGSLTCATCHCYIDEPWLGKVGEPDEEENDLLEMVEMRKSNSRLSCQLVITEELDGLTVHLPEFQF